VIIGVYLLPTLLW